MSYKAKCNNSQLLKEKVDSILHLNKIEVKNIIGRVMKGVIEDRVGEDQVSNVIKGV